MKRRRSTEPSNRSPQGPVVNTIGTLCVLALIVYLNSAAFRGTSPMDTGINSYWQHNLRGQTWVLLTVVDAIVLIKGYRWIRSRTKMSEVDRAKSS